MMNATLRRRNPAGRPGFIRKHHHLGGLNSNSLALLCGSDARLHFIDAMRSAGVVPADPAAIIADGDLHRFRVEGDNPGSKNGWCILHVDGLPVGVYGSWRASVTGTWNGVHGRIAPAQRARLHAEIKRARQRQQAEIAERHRQVQDRARRLWAQAAAPMDDHPYLARKKIEAHGIRQWNKLLVIPLRDGDGVLWNVQTIAADGTKRFLRGARKRGLYFGMGRVERDLLIAEGFATAASLHETTGKPVAVAFDCGNLVPVARVLRAKFPAAKIVIAADNDEGVEGNPGVTKANAAARAVGGFVAIPPEPYNDFNDVAVRS